MFSFGHPSGTDGEIRAHGLRIRLRNYVTQNPGAECVRELPQAARIGFDQYRAWITDALANLKLHFKFFEMLERGNFPIHTGALGV